MQTETAPEQSPWTAERVRALGVTVDLPTAGRIVGLGRAHTYDLARRGELPFPTLRMGKRWVVPTAGLLRALGLDQHDGPPAA